MIVAMLLSAFPVFPARAATLWNITLDTNANLSNGLVRWWTFDAGGIASDPEGDTGFNEIELYD